MSALENLEKRYNKEDEYFFRQNKVLIERKRKEFEARQPLDVKPPHWMKCPKCPGDLTEIALAGIGVDPCGNCRGIYFDPGELEILMESREPKGFLGAMKRLLNPQGPRP